MAPYRRALAAGPGAEFPEVPYARSGYARQGQRANERRCQHP